MSVGGMLPPLNQLSTAAAPYPDCIRCPPERGSAGEPGPELCVESYFGPASTLATVLLLFSFPCAAFVPFVTPCDTRFVRRRS